MCNYSASVGKPNNGEMITLFIKQLDWLDFALLATL